MGPRYVSQTGLSTLGTDWNLVNTMSTPASDCSACWDIKCSSSTASLLGITMDTARPTLQKSAATLQSRHFDIMQKCPWGVHKCGAETKRACGECFQCRNYSCATPLAAGSCICNLKNSMWQRAPARLPYRDRGEPRGDVTLVCLVVLDVWAHRCVFSKNGGTEPKGHVHFWNCGSEGSPTHTLLFCPLFLHSCLLLHKGINSPLILAEGAAGNAWMTFLQLPRDVVIFERTWMRTDLKGEKKKW